MRRKLVDRIVVGALAVVVVIAAIDSVRPSEARRVERSPAAAPVPVRVALRGSPETAFLPTCRTTRLRLAVAPGPRLVLRYRGGRCHLPALRLQATVRDAGGTVVYRGAALAPDALAGNLAGAQTFVAPLSPALLRCRSDAPLAVVVAGSGLAAAGIARCHSAL